MWKKHVKVENREGLRSAKTFKLNDFMSTKTLLATFGIWFTKHVIFSNILEYILQKSCSLVIYIIGYRGRSLPRLSTLGSLYIPGGDIPSSSSIISLPYQQVLPWRNRAIALQGRESIFRSKHLTDIKKLFLHATAITWHCKGGCRSKTSAGGTFPAWFFWWKRTNFLR